MIIIPQRILHPILHIVFWIFIFLYPFLFGFTNFSDENTFTRIFLLTSFQILLFYFNSFLLIPKLLAQRKILIYLSIILFSISIITVLSLLVEYSLNADYNKNNWINHHFLYNSIINSLMVWGISSGLKITSEWFKNERTKREMENQKISAELLNLKSQINPHFLFNSLNSIYSLANKNSDKRTAQTILKLSDMMRYMLHESADNFVALEKEIEYLKNYIELQQMRLKETIPVTFNVTGKIKSKMIAPLLLIPFVENAFKHGISYLNQSFISIELNSNENFLNFKTTNSISTDLVEKEKSSGIGLENVRKRLDLLYPQKHKLQTFKSENSFTIKLQIQLSND